jgi:hypothetical protein
MLKKGLKIYYALSSSGFGSPLEECPEAFEQAELRVS